MLPIRDTVPSRRSAVVTALIIVAAAYIFLGVQPAGLESGTRFLYENATIPCEIVTGQPLSIDEIRAATCSSAPAAPVFADKSVLFSLVASIFFHGSLGHLIGNLWVLWIFGNNVEDVLGRPRYVLFYLVSGLVASAAHIALHPASTVPVVGASGAIAGVMGAYMVLFPSARVTSIIPPFFFFPFQVPAFIFLMIWFLGQFALAGAETNIAWEAHVGGFVAGVIYGLVIRARGRYSSSSQRFR